MAKKPEAKGAEGIEEEWPQIIGGSVDDHSC